MPDAAGTEQFLHVLHQQYGYDFTRYAPSSLRRRLRRLLELDGHATTDDLLAQIAAEPARMQHVVGALTVPVTEMFRDSGFYKSLRDTVLPILATYPFIRIWHAGCATGEEALSMAILLAEAGLLHKSLLYATDINTDALAQARTGCVPLGYMRQYTQQYVAAGGRADFSSYYTATARHACFSQALQDHVVYATHNLVSDWSFNSFQLILCRNVLIYFNKELQSRILSLFDESLDPLCFLALGSKESLLFSGIRQRYIPASDEKIWRKQHSL